MMLEFSVRDELWNQISEKWRSRCLCIECFLKELSEVNPRQGITPDDFIFVGVIDPEEVEGSDPPEPANPEFGGIIVDRTIRRPHSIPDLGRVLTREESEDFDQIEEGYVVTERQKQLIKNAMLYNKTHPIKF